MANEKQAAAPKLVKEKKEKKARTSAPVTDEQRIAAYEAQGGKCFVTGATLNPLKMGKDWTVTDGKAVTKDVIRAKGRLTLDEFRASIAERVADAKATIEQYELLVNADGSVKFYGER